MMDKAWAYCSRNALVPPDLYALHLDVRLVHAPADPHRALAAMKRLFQLGTVFHDPALDGGVVDRHATLLHEFFDMPIAQRVGDIPPHTDQDNVRGEMGALEADHPYSPSLFCSGTAGDHTPESPRMKTCDR